MTQLFSLEFLAAALCIVNVFMFIALGLILKRISSRFKDSGISGGLDPSAVSYQAGQAEENLDDEKAGRSAKDIIEMLTPLVNEAKNAAASFDSQIREKRGLIKNLNDALDSRIININLLLSRADALHKKLEDQQKTFQEDPPARTFSSPMPSGGTTLVDQQNQIIDLYFQKMDVDTIAQKLSLPKGEVQLVIDLKEQFIAMERA
jgi:uncharacterized coiled-coil protein SlyX